MTTRHLIIICSAVAAILVAIGWWRIGFSEISLVVGEGAEAMPAIRLKEGKNLYLLRVDATVAPHYRGDLRVRITGVPGVNYSWYELSSWPFPGRKHPDSDGQDLLKVQPDDRIDLWIVMQPKPPAKADPAMTGSLPPCCATAGTLDRSSLNRTADLASPLQFSLVESPAARTLLKAPIVIGDHPADEDLDGLFDSRLGVLWQ